MKLLTNKKLYDLEEKAYMQGYDDANSVNKALQEKFCADLLTEIEELARNTWDKDRIEHIKEMLNAHIFKNLFNNNRENRP